MTSREREYPMEMSINTTRAEVSQGLLREVSTEARDDRQRVSHGNVHQYNTC